MPLDIRKPRGGPAPVLVEHLTDFTGGLNLADDRAMLKKNESPDMLNVVPDAEGGFSLRYGVQQFSDKEMDIKGMWRFGDRIMAQNGRKIAWTQEFLGGVFTTLPNDLGASLSKVRATTFADVNYMACGVDRAPVKWDGITTNLTTMGDDWNDDYGDPTDGNMPRAKYITSHLSYVWVAGTYEGPLDDVPDNQGQHLNRVRWCHPNKPERWRQLDYIDISIGEDSDVITGLANHTDHLLVFKDNSVYGIYGYDIDTFSVVTLSDTLGAIGQDAIIPTPVGVFFYDRRFGVYLYDGRQIKPVFENIYPAMARGSIPRNIADGDIHLGFVNNKLWATVPVQKFTREENWTLPAYDDVSWPGVNAYSTQANGGVVWNQVAATLGISRVPRNFPDPTAWWCGPPSGNTKIAPIGQWYARWHILMDSPGTYTLHYALDNFGELYVNGVLKDGIGGLERTKVITLNLNSGLNIIAVHGNNKAQDPTSNPTAVVWALYGQKVGDEPAPLIAHSDDSGLCLEYQSPGVPTISSSIERATFVLDLTTGGWTRYDLQMQHFATSESGKTYASQIGTGYVQRLDVEGRFTDFFGDEEPSLYPSSTTYPSDETYPSQRFPNRIDSYYMTSWQDMKKPVVRKRFKRTEVILKGGAVADLPVQLFADWDGTKMKKHFFMHTTIPDSADGLTGMELRTLYADWSRSKALGLHRSVALKIEGPQTFDDWGVDVIALKYKQKRVR